MKNMAARGVASFPYMYRVNILKTIEVLLNQVSDIVTIFSEIICYGCNKVYLRYEKDQFPMKYLKYGFCV